MTRSSGERAELEAMVDQLEAYLASDAAFRTILVELESGPVHRTLTLGLLLQSLAESRFGSQPEAGGGNGGDGGDLHDLRDTIERIRAAHPDAWAAKVAKELRSTANLWCAAVEDLERSEGGSTWRTEALRRTRAQRLIEDASSGGLDVAEPVERLLACDARARRRFKPGPFALDPALAAAHPQAEYWWLYGAP